MIIGRVKASVTATVKIPSLEGRKVLLVEQLDSSGKSREILAVDAVNAGCGDLVLVLDEGGSARLALEAPEAMTIRSVIVGIVDEIESGQG